MNLGTQNEPCIPHPSGGWAPVDDSIWWGLPSPLFVWTDSRECGGSVGEATLVLGWEAQGWRSVALVSSLFV